MASEREDWETLLTHPGFLRLLNRAKAEWVEGLPGKLKQAIASARTESRDVAHAIECIDAGNEAVNQLLSVPQMRIRQLTGDANPDPSRRGGL